VGYESRHEAAERRRFFILHGSSGFPNRILVLQASARRAYRASPLPAYFLITLCPDFQNPLDVKRLESKLKS
jgi:hypothetical protein